jgi:hypothetical protein
MFVSDDHTPHCGLSVVLLLSVCLLLFLGIGWLNGSLLFLGVARLGARIVPEYISIA